MSEDESATSSNIEDPIMASATERVSYPCRIIDYATYKKDLWTLARYVTKEGYYVLGSPEKFPLPPTETLRKEYLSKCMMLAALLDEEVEDVLVTFERWGVPPDSLYESPLHPDINCFYGEGKLGRSGPGPIYGFCYLEELNRALEILGKQWVSTNAAEPAIFWRSHIFQSPNARGY